jgi:hypothetical protein
MGDVAAEMTRRGHKVIVITADRGYSDSRVRYASREVTADGVLVRRLSWTSFGKSSMLLRVAAALSFMVQSFIVVLSTRKLAGILVSTSPPFIGLIAVVGGAFRRIPIAYWAMDLNPDQIVALGKIAPNGLLARFLERCNRIVLRSASLVIALDDVMARRIAVRGAHRREILVIPPWSPDGALTAVPRAVNPFRTQHVPDGAKVIMYSGNHTPSNPLRTLLDAAVKMRNVDSLKFIFIGSGVAKQEVTEYVNRYALKNVISLPYQPKSQLHESLSAGDVHVVSLGDRMAGIIHPCKVYGAMAVGRPILYFGPAPSHVTEIVDLYSNGWSVRHGDVEGTVTILRSIVDNSFGDLDRLGERGTAALRESMNPTRLCSAVCDALEDRLELGTELPCAS